MFRLFHILFTPPQKKNTQRVELRPAKTLGTPLPLPSPLASPGLQNGAPAVVATTHVPAVPGLAHGQHPDPTWRSRSDPSRAAPNSARRTAPKAKAGRRTSRGKNQTLDLLSFVDSPEKIQTLDLLLKESKPKEFQKEAWNICKLHENN